MRFFLCCLAVFLWVSSSFAQFDGGATRNNGNYYGEQRYSQEEIRAMRGSLKNSGDQKLARNILIVKAVADYKIGDEKLQGDFDDLERNREYNEKMNKIMKRLSNKKIRNLKNREVLNILNEAGNKLYNLLSN